ncbi:winged helix-turn-helix transcriptional regulator [Mycolicibacterium bacteremicum]|uniref:Transcriptional regulator n=1 Tax=Mycolicibacterium bacteremicum TaxID=564198 RepID=A0A1W9YWH9_MYCBA|nr:helix-turn-helix domain-containing protein [Mycolicibacterium bacteremicum]MCV7431575.1 helix-turn-helix transcriptional regulator [Mycolicibacterium bacteremicum]ORA04405.1 transcriptional regulator [Mycolicibacterium bacteremicum]
MSSATLVGVLSDRDSWQADDCSVAAALDVVGRRASLLLLREAFYGAHRFEEFSRRAKLSEKITAVRLRELVDEGLLEKRAYHEPGQRRREDYHLTEKGAECLPALLALMRWGDRWVRADGGRVALSHTGCGAPINVEVRCSEGHPVSAGDIQAALRR